MKAFISILILACTVSSTQAQSISWQQANGPYGGIIYAMVDDGEGRIFAATEGDGIFRSTDNGNTWTETNVGLTNSVVYTMAVNNDGVLFAGTAGDGVFRLNPDFSWTAVNNGLTFSTGAPAIIYMIAFNDSGHVFAGTLFRGVFRSTDNGDNWTTINNGLQSNVDVVAVAVNENNELFAATLSGGVFRSTNNGALWTYRGLDDERIYAFLTLPNGEIFAGRFRSIDNGENWMQTFQPGVVVYALTRNAAGVVHAATSSGVYDFSTSTNPPSWISAGTGLQSTLTFSVLPWNGDLFAGTGGKGVYRLQSGTTNWIPSTTGITNVDVRALARSVGTDVYAVTLRSGIFRSTDNGVSWLTTNAGPEIARPVCIAVKSNGTVFVGTQFVTETDSGKVFRSTDNGQTWQQVFQTRPNTDVQSLVVMPNGDVFAATIGDSLYKSTDDGETWQSVNTNLLSTVFFSLSANQSGHLFAGTLFDGLIRSTDGGANWTSLLNNGLPTDNNDRNSFPYVRSMVFNNGGVAFAGTFGYGVYKTSDNGDVWTAPDPGLQNKYILSLAINSQEDVFAGTENGIYRMANNSGNWSSVNTGLGNLYVRSVIVTSGGHLLAGTSTSGIFRTVNPTTEVPEYATGVPKQFSLEQNYPNPFNPRTNVEFRIANFEFVTLRVFDVLGKEIATLVSKELPAGTYSIPWDAASLPSGVYLYQLQAGASIETKKAVLVK